MEQCDGIGQKKAQMTFPQFSIFDIFQSHFMWLSTLIINALYTQFCMSYIVGGNQLPKMENECNSYWPTFSPSFFCDQYQVLHLVQKTTHDWILHLQRVLHPEFWFSKLLRTYLEKSR
jgi:hypothetical protein